MHEQETQEEALQRARDYALRSLVCMDQTESQLSKKLKQRGYAAAVIEQTLIFLKTYGYVNDERFVEQYVMTHCGRLNRKQLLERLGRKGIFHAEIDRYLEEYAYDEQSLLRRTAERYLRGRTLSEPEDRARAAAYLARKGYAFSDIRPVLDDYTASVGDSDSLTI